MRLWLTVWKIKNYGLDSTIAMSLGLCNMEASLLGGKNKRSPMSDQGFPGSSDGKESACNVGDPDLPGLEDPLEKGMAIHSSNLA